MANLGLTPNSAQTCGFATLIVTIIILNSVITLPTAAFSARPTVSPRLRMVPATPSSSLHLKSENIMVSLFSVDIDRVFYSWASKIKQRRKRLILPAPCLYDSLACATTVTSPNIVPSDEDRHGFNLLDIPLAGDSTRELSDSLSHSGSLTYDRRTGESSPIHSQACYHSESSRQTLDHDREGKPITVHEFLEDVTSKIGRKYGRKNRLATVKLGARYPTSSGDRSPAPRTTRFHVQVATRVGNDQRVSALIAHPRIQSRRIARRSPHPRRKQPFAKSLTQRLFEADIFSSGTTPSHPVDTSFRNPAHTSTRWPLQFVTSLNLIPSLESRIHNRRKGVQGDARDGSRVPTPQADQEELLRGSNSARGASSNRLVVVATSGHGSSSRDRNKAPKQRARTGDSAAVLVPGGRAQAFKTRARGGKQSTAQLAPKPFEYVPLPLVWVETRQGAV